MRCTAFNSLAVNYRGVWRFSTLLGVPFSHNSFGLKVWSRKGIMVVLKLVAAAMSYSRP